MVTRTWRYFDDIYKCRNWWATKPWDAELPPWLVNIIIKSDKCLNTRNNYCWLPGLEMAVMDYHDYQDLGNYSAEMINDGIIKLSGKMLITTDKTKYFITFPYINNGFRFIQKMNMQFVCEIIETNKTIIFHID